MNQSAPDSIADDAGRLAFWRRRASVFADACRFISNILALESKPGASVARADSIQTRMQRLADSFDFHTRNAAKALDLQADVSELATQAGKLLYEAIEGGFWHEQWPWEKGSKPGRNLFVYVDDFSPIPYHQLPANRQGWINTLTTSKFRLALAPAGTGVKQECNRLVEPETIPDGCIKPDRMAHAFWFATLNVAALNPGAFRIDPHRLFQVDANSVQESAVKSADVGAGMGWELAKDKGEKHCERNPFPGVKALARIVGCAPSTMSKAISRSAKLRARQAEQKERKRGGVQSLSESTVQSKGKDPSELAATRTDDAFHRLLQDAKPDERAKLKAMTPEKQRELVACLANDDAADPRYRRRSR